MFRLTVSLNLMLVLVLVMPVAAQDHTWPWASPGGLNGTSPNCTRMVPGLSPEFGIGTGQVIL